MSALSNLILGRHRGAGKKGPTYRFNTFMYTAHCASWDLKVTGDNGLNYGYVDAVVVCSNGIGRRARSSGSSRRWQAVKGATPILRLN